MNPFLIFNIIDMNYEIEHPGAIPNSIEASKDFVRNIAFGIDGMYNDSTAALGTVVQYYKDFTAGWRWKGYAMIHPRVITSTSNVSLQWSLQLLF